MPSLLVAIVVVIFLMIMISRVARVVPQQNAWIVERLGKYSATLNAGFHILVPFLDTVRYKHSLKEVALDVPEQVCITRDNVQVAVDGVLYFKVLDPARASYGISDYTYAISQLAQTNLRSEIGKIELDRTFEERTNINLMVVSEVDKPSEAWGVKVLRYEIKNINPPQDVLAAMEKQMRASARSAPRWCSRKGSATPPSMPPTATSSRSSRPRKRRSSRPSTRPKVRPPPSSRLRSQPRTASSRLPTQSKLPAATRPCNFASPRSTSSSSASWRRAATR